MSDQETYELEGFIFLEDPYGGVHSVARQEECELLESYFDVRFGKDSMKRISMKKFLEKRGMANKQKAIPKDGFPE